MYYRKKLTQIYRLFINSLVFLRFKKSQIRAISILSACHFTPIYGMHFEIVKILKNIHLITLITLDLTEYFCVDMFLKIVLTSIGELHPFT